MKWKEGGEEGEGEGDGQEEEEEEEEEGEGEGGDPGGGEGDSEEGVHPPVTFILITITVDTYFTLDLYNLTYL